MNPKKFGWFWLIWAIITIIVEIIIDKSLSDAVWAMLIMATVWFARGYKD